MKILIVIFLEIEINHDSHLKTKLISLCIFANEWGIAEVSLLISISYIIYVV